ncbi:MAG: hypothetical protein QW739_03150, partial [Candidatus Odinarchaeota archaeon]
TANIQAKSETPINSITAVAVQANKVLKAAWDETAEIALEKAEDTWHLISKIAVITHISDMIHRTKSTITVVLPELDDTIVNMLSTANPRIRIHLIAGLNLESDTDKIKKLLVKGNIRVWDRPEKDFFGAARDNEEALLAPNTGIPQKIVAIISHQPEYVDLVHRVLGPMWMASSKEIKEKDLF